MNSYSAALPEDKLLGPVSKIPSQVLTEHLQHRILPGAQHQGPYCKQLLLLKTKLKARCAGRVCPAVTWKRREGQCCHMRQDQNIFKSKAENQISHWVVGAQSSPALLAWQCECFPRAKSIFIPTSQVLLHLIQQLRGLPRQFQKKEKAGKRNKCLCMSSRLFVVE